MSASEGTVAFEDGETWYRITGSLDAADRAPLVVLHGGPGATHDYLLSLADLATGGRAVVHYDQFGNGRSSHRPDRGADFWTVELFVRELENLVGALGIAERHHVLGQSWGGFLAQEYALTQPGGLCSVVLADTAASFPAFVAEANRLRAELPPEVEATLRRHEDAGTTGDPEYEQACLVFYGRHVCRVEWPPEVAASFEWIDRDPTVYHTMNGPSEFHCIGSLKTWDITDRLPEISTPTLLVSGRHDEATPHIVEQIHTRIPGAQWRIFEESSHMPHVEEPEGFLETVEAFLKTID